jgi:hypothetical protein
VKRRGTSACKSDGVVVREIRRQRHEATQGGYNVLGIASVGGKSDLTGGVRAKIFNGDSAVLAFATGNVVRDEDALTDREGCWAAELDDIPHDLVPRSKWGDPKIEHAVEQV